MATKKMRVTAKMAMGPVPCQQDWAMAREAEWSRARRKASWLVPVPVPLLSVEISIEPSARRMYRSRPLRGESSLTTSATPS